MSTRLDRIIEKAFLGGEFLTWLWYASEQGNGLFSVGGDAVEVSFDDLLVLESLLAESQENTFKGGEPTLAEEARLALRLGKKVSKAKLRLRRQDREWAFTIKASTLDMASVKLPAVMSKIEDDQFFERLYLLEELDRTFDELYLGFLRRRLSPDWETKELPRVRAWVEAGEEGPVGGESVGAVGL